MKWSKRPKSLTEKGEFGPHALPISGRFPKETLGVSWHWQVGITPRQVSAISRMRSPWNHRAGPLPCPEGSRTSPQDERLLLNHANTPGFLAPGGEEFNPGPETRLDRSELLCNKVLLKYKGDRESF